MMFSYAAHRADHNCRRAVTEYILSETSTKNFICFSCSSFFSVSRWIPQENHIPSQSIHPADSRDVSVGLPGLKSIGGLLSSFGKADRKTRHIPGCGEVNSIRSG
jgi:hypothetical protein